MKPDRFKSSHVLDAYSEIGCCSANTHTRYCSLLMDRATHTAYVLVGHTGNESRARLAISTFRDCGQARLGGMKEAPSA